MIKFPDHAASLHLTHNDHLGSYETVAERVRDKDHGYEDEDWISEEQKQKAIDTNEVWTIQWYPHTPVGFCIKSAADLDELLEWVVANQ